MGDESVTTADDPATAADDPERVKGALMYVGIFGDKYVWTRVDDLPNAGEPHPGVRRFVDDPGKAGWTFEVQLVSAAAPGMIYEFEFDTEFTTVYYREPKKGRRPANDHAPYLGRWKNGADCARWRAELRAAEADRDAVKAMTRESKARPDLECLGPVREAYRRLPAPARAQLIAQVVSYIVRGGTKS